MKTKIRRRTFVTTTALGSLAVYGGISGSNFFNFKQAIAKTQGSNALPMPPLLEGKDIDGTKTYDLTLQNGSTEFFQGVQTRTSGINGSYLGPTLKMRNGDKVRINVKNTLGETSTLHWHGAHLPASQDGGPHQVIKNGETWSPEFQIKQKAASLWYHPHLEGKTGEHVWRGMAGMMIIEDDEADALNLPNTYGVDDIPVILQDRNFTRNGAMPYDNSMHSAMMGLSGDTPLTNGSITPHFDSKSNLLRLRILNASNASFYNLGFADNKKFKQIASDGGLLEVPVEMNRILLAPAERAEIIVELNEGENVTLKNHKWTPAGGMMGGRGMGMMGRRGMGMMGGGNSTPEFEFLHIRAANSFAQKKALPSKLATIDRFNESDVGARRVFELQMNMGPRVMMGLLASHLINGKVMKHNRIDETVKLGATEIWEIRNSSFMAHPFHIHDVQFQILDRNGNKPSRGESGRKDVVLVNPGEAVRLIMKFEDYADPKSPFMYHCHILEHEDAGMMGQFVVV